MPIRASTFPSVQWYTICFFPVTYTVVGFQLSVLPGSGRVVFPNQSVLPMPGFKKQTPQGPLPELLSEVQHRQIMGQLGKCFQSRHHGSLPSKILRVGEPGICNVRKRSGPCYLNLYAQSKTGRSTSRQQTGKGWDLVRDWKRQKRKPDMLIRECFSQTGPGGKQRPPDSALQYL